ncbi:MAG TPA: 16S rRNA (cytosine(1402)-N(4))-methyltransferase RsmH [Egibacteraceae bacterium]|nr:16S rRNA (cytosine(1402)-N(4))-methyltransferase RsmH [Egibacteraceae bacterium]
MIDLRTPHDPVMVDRVVELLAYGGAEPGVLVDATVGAAGHAAALLAASGESVHLMAFDRDPDALALAQRRLAAYGERAHLVHAGYDRLAEHVEPLAARVGPLLGVLYDLGVSSMQLDRAERGFSFRGDAPLDMRMNPDEGQTAAELIDSVDVAELARLLRVYGEERFAGRVARAIIRARPISTTGALAAIVDEAVPAASRGRTHPATRTFQALRIAVNDELDRFSASLPQALELIAPAAPPSAEPAPDGRRGGRIVVLAYHSLEDRLAKRAFADAARGCICPPDLPVCGCGREPIVRLLTRGAERPSPQEIERNPRARGAKLRAVERAPRPSDPES